MLVKLAPGGCVENNFPLKQNYL
uniref:Uncharacterized protein n=1 Tax=Arundo donax TaxID=35708 RepID=A0A0A9BT79_ARUDO